jgi:hypothetical protein
MTDKLTIPKLPTQESLVLLLRAKRMLSHALEHSNQKSEFDNMIAILGFDNTIEYILKTIVFHLDLESITGKSFDTFELSNLAGTLNKTLIDMANVHLPYLAEIKMLRQTRNLVQHGAIAPNADLKRFSTICERFFTQILLSVFGLKVDDLRISSVIEDNQTKKYLSKAEAYVDAGKWLETIVQTRNAFENEYFKRIKNLDISLSLYPSLVYAGQSHDIAGWGFNTIKRELELSCLGINDPDYRHFKEYLDHIPSNYRPEDSGGHTILQRSWEKDDAIFCYSYVANVVLGWQAKEKERLYVPKLDVEYVFNETIAGINITKESEHGCYYFFGGDEMLHLFYTSKAIKRRFEKLKKNKIYMCKSVEYVNGKRNKVHEKKMELLGQYIFLMTNEPERWGVVIWYRIIKTGQ